MKRKLAAWGLVLALLAGLLPWALATDPPPGRVILEEGVPDGQGLLSVSLTFADVTFRVFQLSLRYDPAVLCPADEQGGPAETFRDFAEGQVPWLSTVGTGLDRTEGLIQMTGYIAPGEEGEAINEDTECVSGHQGVTLYTFRFKRLAEGDAGLELAGTSSCPDGIMVMGKDGGAAVSVVFRKGAAPMEETAWTLPLRREPAPPVRTAEELLKGAVILKADSHAAVVAGGVRAIYPGEGEVTAFVDRDRVYLPLRFVAEALGAQVRWEGESRTAVLEKDGTEIRVRADVNDYIVQSQVHPMDAPAVLVPIGGGLARMMVPIRFVADGLGYDAHWDEGRRMAVLTPRALEWKEEGPAEETALTEAAGLLALYGSFV